MNSKIFLQVIFIFLLFLPPILGIVHSKRSIQAKQEKYDKFAECINERSESIDRWRNQRPFEALIFPRGASIKLECFEW